MKKCNIVLILLMIGYSYSIAQPIQYDNGNVDSIIIRSASGYHNMKEFYCKEEVYILCYDTDIDNFTISGYIKMQDVRRYKKVERNTIKKYDIQYDIKEKIQFLLSAIEQTYRPVNLSDFGINENNIVPMIDSTMRLYKKYYLQDKFKNYYIQECKNIDTFRLFLTEHYSRNLANSYRSNSSSGSGFSIYIKTSLNTYYISSSSFYASKQPWNKFLNGDMKLLSSIGIVNFNINNSLLEILPKDFFQIIDLTNIGVIWDYIEWYVERKEIHRLKTLYK